MNYSGAEQFYEGINIVFDYTQMVIMIISLKKSLNENTLQCHQNFY